MRFGRFQRQGTHARSEPAAGLGANFPCRPSTQLTIMLATWPLVTRGRVHLQLAHTGKRSAASPPSDGHIASYQHPIR